MKKKCGHLESTSQDLCIWVIIYHYSDIIMRTMTFQITSVSIVCSTFCSGPDQRKHQSSASLAFVRGIQWWPVDSHHKGTVTWKLFPFDDVIIIADIAHILHGYFIGTGAIKWLLRYQWCNFEGNIFLVGQWKTVFMTKSITSLHVVAVMRIA